jgi:hypothetical protein
MELGEYADGHGFPLPKPVTRMAESAFGYGLRQSGMRELKK